MNGIDTGDTRVEDEAATRAAGVTCSVGRIFRWQSLYVSLKGDTSFHLE